VLSGGGISALEHASLLTLGVAAGLELAAGDVGGGLGTISSMLSQLASYERRREEWSFQQDLAREDLAIGSQQIQIAHDQVSVAEGERRVAALQLDQAQSTVEFLGNKFTNAQLFEWMAGVLGRVYAYLLRQATAVARLAGAELTFERHEPLPSPTIQDDYWQPPAASPVGGKSGPDRRGLTGAERLLRDITQLDQFAFETNQRKLQLSKTLSLALLSPLELERLRQTGVMHFSTQLEMFDRNFPGHYLRLIKRVRVSLIALTPPSLGIRATLSTSGLSRVVVAGDQFRTIVVRRNPESVALSSPQNATGLFELDAQSELLQPFENTGVDTRWTFELDRAANPFDFGTISDVLVTIDYTALSDDDYRAEVISGLPTTLSGERPFSLRNDFADALYELNHPEDSPTPMTVRLSVPADAFPPGARSAVVSQVAVYFAAGAGFAEVRGLSLRLLRGGGGIGGLADTVAGVVTTRSPSGATWLPMVGASPVGTWELSLPGDDATLGLFTNEILSDIGLIITFSAEAPPWPA
jgi:hypothetical protein